MQETTKNRTLVTWQLVVPGTDELRPCKDKSSGVLFLALCVEKQEIAVTVARTASVTTVKIVRTYCTLIRRGCRCTVLAYKRSNKKY